MSGVVTECPVLHSRQSVWGPFTAFQQSYEVFPFSRKKSGSGQSGDFPQVAEPVSNLSERIVGTTALSGFAPPLQLGIPLCAHGIGVPGSCIMIHPAGYTVLTWQEESEDERE